MTVLKCGGGGGFHHYSLADKCFVGGFVHKGRKLLRVGQDPVQAKLDTKTAIKERLDTTFEGVTRAWF